MINAVMAAGTHASRQEADTTSAQKLAQMRTALLHKCVYVDFVERFCDDVRNIHTLMPSLVRQMDHETEEPMDQDRQMHWKQSLVALASVLRQAGLTKQIILLEYSLPKADRHGQPPRMDALILGQNIFGQHSASIIELKGWDSITGESKRPGMVWVMRNGSAREEIHPTRQAAGYILSLKGLLNICGVRKDFLTTQAFVYLYNIRHTLSPEVSTALFGGKSTPLRLLVSLNTGLYAGELANKLRRSVGKGAGIVALERLLEVHHRAKKLCDESKGGEEVIGNPLGERTRKKIAELLRRVK